MTDGNEPASPFTWWDHSLEGPAPRETYSGLTKREAFAMAAMQGMCADGFYDVNDPTGRPAQRCANAAVRHADALIAALNGEDQ